MPFKGNTGSRTRGFTLIELLIVIGIIGILAAIILVAVDPAKRLKQARDARRNSEVNAILNAILNYTVDNKGNAPAEIDSAATSIQIIGSSTSTCAGLATSGCDEAGFAVSTTACANLAANTELVDKYISEIPVDPAGTDSASSSVTWDSSRTGYYVNKSANGRLEVGSCNPEDTTSIKVKR